jgi:hypothetical protein
MTYELGFILFVIVVVVITVTVLIPAFIEIIEKEYWR